MSDFLTINDAESFCDDELSAWTDKDGNLVLSIENPWAGSTETGFGYTSSINVTRDQAKELAVWLFAKFGH